jgi:2-haloacid dehalogenase
LARTRDIVATKGQPMPVTTAVFDAYGTLFDVAAAAREAAKEPDFAEIRDTWPTIADHWRLKQLQYTWLRAITGQHTDFWTVTQNGLDWALERTGHGENPALRARLLQLYHTLSAFPEVPEMLANLRAKGMNTAILSNGSPDMLNGAVTSAGIMDLLDDVLSVEAVGIFKPHASVYDLVGQRFDCAKTDVVFVSSNGWDASAAAGYGFHTVWVNRAGEPEDRLPDRPGWTLSDLSGLPELVDGM